MGAAVANAVDDCCARVSSWGTIPGSRGDCATADNDDCCAGAERALGMPVDGSGLAEATSAGAAFTGAAAGGTVAVRACAHAFATGASMVLPALAAIALSLA